MESLGDFLRKENKNIIISKDDVFYINRIFKNGKASYKAVKINKLDKPSKYTMFLTEEEFQEFITENKLKKS